MQGVGEAVGGEYNILALDCASIGLDLPLGSIFALLSELIEVESHGVGLQVEAFVQAMLQHGTDILLHITETKGIVLAWPPLRPLAPEAAARASSIKIDKLGLRSSSLWAVAAPEIPDPMIT
ncbi:hypothetical protein HG530_014693 [Fusarium avenaceum]|nr:hypothetical protein HG530_014693 [Fusarium avenaceum]